MSVFRVLLGGACVLLAVGACGGSDGDAGFGSGSNGVGGTPNIDLSNISNTATSSGGGVTDPDLDGCKSTADATGCIGEAYEGENIPLDIYVMFDLSCSMSCSIDKQGCCRRDDPVPTEDWRIQPVREAMRAFLEDSLSHGIGVGLGFFGDHDSSEDNDPEVCSVANHSDATVEIATLPGSSSALISALDAGEPQGGTPTHLALGGACEYVNAWRGEHLSHKVVILLVTDGIPEAACNANIQLATQAAADCYDDGDGFQTYVLGVVANNNNSLDQLNQIAVAGGTDDAYLTDRNDIAGSVLEALNAIRADAAIPCTLPVPEPRDGSTLDYNYVNLGICDAGGVSVSTYYVPDESDCVESGGWYYEDTSGGRAIQLCEATCDTVSISGSQLFFSVGCQRIEGPVE
jgi:hypothetical protein